jgi:uncharacterized membrane protein
VIGENGNNGSAIPTRDPLMRRLELLISNVLRVGVIASVALIVVGTVLVFMQHPAYLNSPDELPKIVSTGATFPHTFDVLLVGLRGLQGEAVVTLGLLVLMGTPVIRVAVSMIAFIYNRDRVYTLITAAVLCLLFISLLLGRAD